MEITPVAYSHATTDFNESTCNNNKFKLKKKNNKDKMKVRKNKKR